MCRVTMSCRELHEWARGDFGLDLLPDSLCIWYLRNIPERRFLSFNCLSKFRVNSKHIDSVHKSMYWGSRKYFTLTCTGNLMVFQITPAEETAMAGVCIHVEKLNGMKKVKCWAAGFTSPDVKHTYYLCLCIFLSFPERECHCVAVFMSSVNYFP